MKRLAFFLITLSLLPFAEASNCAALEGVYKNCKGLGVQEITIQKRLKNGSPVYVMKSSELSPSSQSFTLNGAFEQVTYDGGAAIGFPAIQVSACNENQLVSQIYARNSIQEADLILISRQSLTLEPVIVEETGLVTDLRLKYSANKLHGSAAEVTCEKQK